MQVPDYNQQTLPNPQPTVRQSANLDGAMFGANVAQSTSNVAQAIGQGGQMVEQQVQRQQERTNLQAVLKATNDASADMANTMAEYMSKQGHDASGITTQAHQYMADTMLNYVNSLVNPAQQIAFTQMMNDTLKYYQTRIAQHEAQQKDVAIKTDASGIANTAINNIASNPYDLANVKVSLDKLRYAYQGAYGTAYGKEYLDNLIQGENSKAIAGGVSSILSLNPESPDYETAAKFLEANKIYINANTYNHLNTTISVGREKLDSLNVANNLFQKYGFDINKGLNDLKDAYGSEPAKLQAYSKIYEGVVQDQKRIKSEEDYNYRLNLGQQIDGMTNVTDKVNAIQGATLPINEKNALINAVKAQDKALQDPAVAAVDKQMMRYGMTGLYKDQQKLAEYQRRIENGDDIYPQQQTIYNEAAIRYNNFSSWYSSKNGDKLTQSGNEEQPQEQAIDNSPVAQAIRQAASKVDENGNRVYSREQILDQLHKRGITGYDDYVW